MLLTRHDAGRIERGEMMSVEDVLEILAVPLLGIVPESQAVLRASNEGVPVVMGDPSDAGRAYEEAVARLLGETVKQGPERKQGLFSRLFKRTA